MNIFTVTPKNIKAALEANGWRLRLLCGEHGLAESQVKADLEATASGREVLKLLIENKPKRGAHRNPRKWIALPSELFEKLEKLAEQGQTTLNAYAVIALERHVKGKGL